MEKGSKKAIHIQFLISPIWMRRIAIGIAIVKGVLFSLVSAGTVWLTATNKLDYTELSRWDQFQLGVGCFVAWGTTMMAWLSKSATSILEGRIPGIQNGREP